MKILAVETSSPQGSLALLDNDKIIDECIWTKKILGSNNPSHSELLTESSRALLTQQGLAFKDVNLVAVGSGPGSFTGIRVGINFVRALSYALNIPCFVLDSLSVIAAGVPTSQVSKDKDLLVTVSAFRNFFYFAQFRRNGDSWTIIDGPGVKTFDSVSTFGNSNVEVVGDAALNLKSSQFSFSIVNSVTYPLAKSLAVQAYAARDSSSGYCSWKNVIPLYIRRSEAEEKFGVVSE